MDKYSYKDVIIDPDDPRVAIGAEYWFGMTPKDCIGKANSGKMTGRLAFMADEDKPFGCHTGSAHSLSFPCIICKKEPKKKWVPFDFDDPKVRKELMGKTIVNNYGLDGEGEFREEMIVGFENKSDEDRDCWSSNGYTDGTIVWTSNSGFHADEFLKKCTFLDGTPCGQEVEE